MRKPGFATFVLVGLFAASSAAVGAEGNQTGLSPRRLVSNLYRLRLKEKDPLGNPTDSKSLGHYFSDQLTRLYIQDQLEAKGEVGRLDFDPLYDAQDTGITDFKVGEPVKSKDGVVVTVRFRNFKKPCRINFDLIETKNGWRISDIRYREGRSLRRILEMKFP